MNKEFFRKNKKVFFISLIVVCIALAFLLKSNSVFKNGSATQAGLVYNNETFNDLVNRDTDGDGVMDWEESLWGTNPTKTDTNSDGIGDAAEIAKMKQASGKTTTTQDEEKLTQTDKFSRELFTTVSALNQTGGLDQNTVDQLSAKIAQQVKNPDIRKLYVISNIKTVKDSATSGQTYKTALDALFKKYPSLSNEQAATSIAKIVTDILQQYSKNGEDAAILTKFDPLIKDIDSITVSMAKMSVPEKFAILHLNAINAFEQIAENLSDMKQVDTDPIVALGAGSKFSGNIDTLQNAASKLVSALVDELKLR